MHPDIIEFWRNAGYYNFRGGNTLYNGYYVAFHERIPKGTGTILAEYIGNNNIVYFFKNGLIKYSEEEMLKLIKLKAFI